MGLFLRRAGLQWTRDHSSLLRTGLTLMSVWVYVCFLMLQSGCSRAVLNKNRSSTHEARAGRRTIFASPYGARRVLMHASLRAPYRFRVRTQPGNSPCGDRKGPVRPRTAKYDARAGVLPILVVSIPLRVRKAAVRHPWGSRAGPVGYEKHCRFPCGARTMPVRAPHGVPVESWELFDQTISIQSCQTVRGP